MRFCPECGTALIAGARFCVECGTPLGAVGSAPSFPESRIARSIRSRPTTTAFAGICLGIVIVGLLAAEWVTLRKPATIRPASDSAGPAMIPPGSGVNSMGGTAGNAAPGQLPPGHPKIQLPAEARSSIDKLEEDAREHPNDIAKWNKLGGLAMRVAMFDRSYNKKAAEAYRHVLAIAPGNLEALRGVGDVDYDTGNYDRAIVAYEKYLRRNPHSPEVITDLGTMYLYTGDMAQAVAQYQKALTLKPDMFRAYFNLGAAYAQQGKAADAQATFKRAEELAPDDNARNRVQEVIAKISAQGPSQMVSNESATPASRPAARSTFQGRIDQVVQGLPIAGPKVGAVEWPDRTTAKVLMNNFPMDHMPAFARDKFLADLRSGIASAKKDYNITGKVEVDLVDGASGQVMQRVTE